jgi:hypothetical protein
MNLIRAIQILADAEVEFVVIGGWSAIIHGSSHMTNDLDVCFSRNHENLKRIARALSPYHPRLRDLPPDLPFVWDESTVGNATVLTLTTDLGDLDLLAEVAGVGCYDDALAHSTVVRSFDRDVRTLDLPALIASKRAAGRVKDQLILPELEALLAALKKP